MKLIKILWDDFIHTPFANITAEILKVFIFVVATGGVTYFVGTLFNIFNISLMSISNYFITFFILGCIVIIGVCIVVFFLYAFVTIISTPVKLFKNIPKYIESIKDRMHV